MFWSLYVCHIAYCGQTVQCLVSNEISNDGSKEASVAQDDVQVDDDDDELAWEEVNNGEAELASELDNDELLSGIDVDNAVLVFQPIHFIHWFLIPSPQSMEKAWCVQSSQYD